MASEVKRITIEAEVQSNQLNSFKEDIKNAGDEVSKTENKIKRLNDELVTSALRASTLQQQYDKTEKEMIQMQGAARKLAILQREATNPKDAQRYSIALKKTNAELDKVNDELKAIAIQAKKSGTQIRQIKVPDIKKSPFAKLGDIKPIQAARQSVAGLASSIGGSGGLVSTLGGVAAAANPIGIGIGAALAIGTAAFNVANNEGKAFEDRLLSLQSILGLNTEELERLKNAALSAGVSFQSEFGEVEITKNAIEAASAFEIIGSKVPVLLQSQEALEGFTQRVLVLDQASQSLSFDGAVSALTTSVNQYLADGASYNEAVALATVLTNQLAEASKLGAIPIDEQAATLQKFGAVANSNNVSTAESIALVETLGQKFNDPALTGTALRNVIQTLALQQGEFALKNGDVTGSLEAVGNANLSASEFVKIFGRENESAARILIGNIGQLRTFTGALEDQAEASLTSGTAAKQAAINSQGLSNAQKNLSNQITNIKASIGTGLTPVLTSLTKGFSNVIKVGQGLWPVIQEIGEGIRIILTPFRLLIDLFRSTSEETETAEEKAEKFEKRMNFVRLAFRLLLTPLTLTLAVIGRISKAFDIAKAAGGGFINTLKALANAVLLFDVFELPEIDTTEQQKSIEDLKKEGEGKIDIDIDTANAQKSLSELKAELSALKKARSEASTREERLTLTTEINRVQKEIRTIELEYKPDKLAGKKIKEAEKEQREKEKAELDEARELEAIIRLSAKIEVETLKTDGSDSVASLERQLEEQLRQLEQGETFQKLSLELQASARLNIEDQFAKKITKVRQNLAKDSIQIQEDQLDQEVQNINRTFAETSLALDSSFAKRLQNEQFTADEIKKLEDEIAEKKISAAKKALSAQLEATNKLLDLNEERITQINTELETADEGERERLNTELVARTEYQTKLKDTVVGIEKEQNEEIISSTKSRLGEEEEEEEKSQEQKLAEAETYLGFANQLNGLAGDVFAAQKERELALAGDNKEKIAEIELKDFNRRKALALVDVAIGTASAIIQAIAKFGPPPSPLGIAGIAIAGTIGAVQAGIIASQQPPAFFDGTPSITIPAITGKGGKDSIPAIVDGQHPIRVHSGERITSKKFNDMYGDVYDQLESGKPVSDILADAIGMDRMIMKNMIELDHQIFASQKPGDDRVKKPTASQIQLMTLVDRETMNFQTREFYKLMSEESKEDIEEFKSNMVSFSNRSALIQLENELPNTLSASEKIKTISPFLSVNGLSLKNSPDRSIQKVSQHNGLHVGSESNQPSSVFSSFHPSKMIYSPSNTSPMTLSGESVPIRQIIDGSVRQNVIENSQRFGKELDTGHLADKIAQGIKMNEADRDHIYVRMLNQNEKIIQILKNKK